MSLSYLSQVKTRWIGIRNPLRRGPPLDRASARFVFVLLVSSLRARRVGIVLSRQAGHRKGDGARCKGYCFQSGGKLADSKGDGARCHRSFDSRGPE